jgi:putative glycerol-1-phosphate prenyltransferase
MIYTALQQARSQGRKQLAVLIDPDKTSRESVIALADMAAQHGIDYFFWGGSLISDTQADYYLSLLRSHTQKPIVLFPGNMYQISPRADGILLLSLISGRNPDLLIGQHVLAAPRLKKSKLEVLPTGYILIDGGVPTSVSYLSNTQPIPADKPDIARCTALAGIMLGLRLIYLDAGSGARRPVGDDVIAAVRHEVDVPLIVGGGLRSPEAAVKALEAGADLVVVGNSLEKDISWLPDLCAAVRSVSSNKAERIES